jgi:hypothetical protein
MHYIGKLFALSSSGGEGWGEEAVTVPTPTHRFMQREPQLFERAES